MKKPSSLGEQVKQAQKAMSSWSDLQKNTVYLQGTDAFLSRRSNTPADKTHHTTENLKRKAHA